MEELIFPPFFCLKILKVIDFFYKIIEKYDIDY